MGRQGCPNGLSIRLVVHDDLLATEWLQREGIGVNTPTTAQAVEAVARNRAFHPVIDYLSDLRARRQGRGWTLAGHMPRCRANRLQ